MDGWMDEWLISVKICVVEVTIMGLLLLLFLFIFLIFLI
jgi:hypothetical protein